MVLTVPIPACLQLSLDKHGRARTDWQGEASHASFLQLEAAQLLRDSGEYYNVPLSGNSLLGKGDFLRSIQVSLPFAVLQFIIV